MRIADRERLRAARAERLARLRRVVEPAASDSEDDNSAALEAFLRALTGRPDAAPTPPEAPAPAVAAVLNFQRPEASPPPAAPGDLDRLKGAGPGLVWALERAGITHLADIAGLAPEELAGRLGPLGRLVPVDAWIAAARAQGDPAAPRQP